MNPKGRKRTLRIAGLALMATTAGLVVGSFAPANASLTNTSMVMSNNAVNASSTYTAIFSTGTALVTDLIVALPSTVSGLSAANTTVYTASSCAGTFAQQSLSSAAVLSGDNIALPISIATAGTCVKVVMTGLTNGSSTGTAYACEADALGGIVASLTPTNVGNLVCSVSGLAGGVLGSLLSDATSIALSYVAQATNGITTALNVAPALTTSVDSAYQSFSIAPTTSGVEASNASQALTVATNAQNYTVEGLVGGAGSDLTWAGGSGHSIPFGYTESTGSSAASCSGSGTSFGSNGTYSALQSGVAGLTNGKVTNINYCWNVDYTDPAGLYNATVTYLVVPSF
ncbi:MAG TPA: hypothetical protein VKI19_05985 [Acidimicrobiales bacterium]|nr:hypothetical protein [Acidimicrobiales bacterium]